MPVELVPLITDFALSIGANSAQRALADLADGSPVRRAIAATAQRYGADRRRIIKAALGRWVESGGFVALLVRVREGERAEAATDFVESFRASGGYDVMDPSREQTAEVIARFVEDLRDQLMRSGDLRPLSRQIDRAEERLAEGQRSLARGVGALQDRAERADAPVEDWRIMDEHSREWMDRTRETIGDVHLPRASERASLAEVFSDHRSVVLVGESGAGKSAIARAEALSAWESEAVVWVPAQALSDWTLAEWRARLGLRRSVRDLVADDVGRAGLLVLDGVDRLAATEGLGAVVPWINAVEAASWRVLITCTVEAWSRVQSELTSQGVSVEADAVVEVGGPDPGELEEVWREYPELGVLKDRDEVTPVLRPKVLDLLARNRERLGGALAFGESDAARLFWSAEIAPNHGGSGRAHAARALAVALGDRQRPALRESTVFDDLPAVGPAVLDALVADHVVTRIDGAVGFAHDLYADWARAHVLREEWEEGSLAEFLSGRSESLVWLRAVRLLGVDLLEQQDNSSAWLYAFDVIAGGHEADGAAGHTLLGDALLESLAASVTRGIGLLRDDVWPLLVRDNGRLLRRLLRRLRTAATRPNRALVAAIEGEGDADLARAVARSSRLPAWSYWYGIVSLLHRRRGEIPLAAAADAAEAVDLWLRATSPGFPFRAEAAAVAVALGEAVLRDKQARNRVFVDDEPDRAVYRAVLAAGHEDPDAVAQIVLEGLGRRPHRHGPPPPTEEEREARAARPRSFPSMFRPSGRMVGPFPYGPDARPDGALQAAVWTADGLLPLCRDLPELAGEALVASLVSAPREVAYRSDWFGEYAIEWPTQWAPGFYTDGPFLGFLPTNENAAVEAILQLLDHALERWIDNVEWRAREEGLVGPVWVPSVELWVDGEPRRFFGDSNVFDWVGHGPGHGNAISVALLVLEKHLYDRAERGDDVSSLVGRLLNEGRSLAVVGVLTSVLQRHPDLADSQLLGLIASPVVAHLVHSRAQVRQSPMGQEVRWIGYVRLPEFVRDEHEAWHTAPHRSRSWLEVGSFAVVGRPDLADEIDRARSRLLARLRPGGPDEGWDLAEEVATVLDPTNYYAVTDPDGQPAVAYRPPVDRVRRQQEAALEEMRATLLDTLPTQAAMMYGRRGADDDGGTGPSAVDAALDALAPDDAPGLWEGRSDVAIARAALCLHPSLGSQSSDRVAWARRVVLDASETLDPTWGLYSFVGNRLRPPSVLPRAVIALLVRDPDDADARAAVARHVSVSPPHDLAALAQMALVFSDDLGDDHARLVNALFRRAAIGARLASAEQQLRMSEVYEHLAPPPVDLDAATNIAEGARQELAAVEAAFIDRSIPAEVPDLDELAPTVSRPGSAQQWKRPRPYRPVTDELLSPAFLAFPDDLPSDGVWADGLRRLADQVFGPLAAPPGVERTEVDGLPDGWEGALIERVAAVVAGSGDPDGVEPLWMRVLDIGASSDGWVEPFLHEVTRRIIVPDPRPAALETWRRMIRYALRHPGWSRGARRAASSWRALVGLSSVVGAREWSTGLRPAFEAAREEILAWADGHLADASSVGWFAGVLSKEAFAGFVAPGLVRLAAAASADARAFWGHSHSGESAVRGVSGLLTHVWDHRRGDLQAPEVKEAFSSLLLALTEKQDPATAVLAEEVRVRGV